jgi:asparagine synthase (glutamine-hydrolysing)
MAAEVFEGSEGYNVFDAFVEIFNEGNCSSYINRMTRFDQKTLLPALLHVEDRTSMAVSLESRVPLLDHRIAELAASMPPMIKYRGGRSKHIFRKVIQHTTPPAVFERKDKMGFPVPLHEWYQEGIVRDFVRETLLSTKAKGRGLLRVDRLETLLDSERAYGRVIWGLLSLELWMKIYVDGKSSVTA